MPLATQICQANLFPGDKIPAGNASVKIGLMRFALAVERDKAFAE